MSVRKPLIRQKIHFKADGVSQGPSPTICIFEIGWHEVCHPPAVKQLEDEYYFVELLLAQGLRKGKKVSLRWNHFEERQIPKQIQFH